MWWTALLAGLVWMLYRFFSDSKQQTKDVKQQGGMKVKYKTLIDFILSSDSSCRIINETSTAMLIGVTGSSGSTFFDIIQTFGNVTIQYKVKSIVFGNHKLEWDFHESMDQNLMIEHIQRDISDYNLKMMSRFK